MNPIGDDTLWIAWTAQGHPLKVEGKRLYGTKADWAVHTNMRAAEFEVFDPAGKDVSKISPLWSLDDYVWPDRAAAIAEAVRQIEVRVPGEAQSPPLTDPEQQVIEIHYEAATGTVHTAYCPITPTEDSSVELGFVTIADRVFVRTIGGDLIAVKRIFKISGLTE